MDTDCALRDDSNELTGTRPLIGISNFVAEPRGLAKCIEQCRRGKISQHYFSKIIRALVDQYKHPIPQFRRLALLDLLMLETALTVLGFDVLPSLRILIDSLSFELAIPPSLTYELIVLNNPVGDTRCFLTGHEREYEKQFYNKHQVIEDHLARCLILLTEVFSMDLDANTSEAIAELIDRTNAEYSAIGELMRGFFATYPQTSFAALRPFLRGTRGIPGASGLYSGGHFAVRFLLLGPRLGERIDFARSNLGLFPSDLTPFFAQYYDGVLSSRGIVGKVTNSCLDESVKGALVRLLKTISTEMGSHQMVVKKVIPDVYDGKDGGTGGKANSGEFLKAGNKIIADAISELLG